MRLPLRTAIATSTYLAVALLPACGGNSNNSVSYTVTPSGTNAATSPAIAQSVVYGGTQAFVVTPLNGYTAPSHIVGGTCPVGTWSGTTYTTGTITTSCTVSFKGSKNRIFMTHDIGGGVGSFSGNLNGISGADLSCAGDTSNPDAGGTWKTLLVDSGAPPHRQACSSNNCTTNGTGEHIDWVLQPSTTYFRPDGTSIGTTNSVGLFSFNLTNAINPDSITALTGLSANWTTNSNNCQNWASSAGGDLGASGVTAQTDATSIFNGTVSCALNHYVLYCVEQ